MKKRTCVKIISYATTFLVVLSAWGFSGNHKATYYQHQLENNYQQTLNELGEYMGNIDSTLSKSIYAATDTMMAELSSQLWRESSGAKSSMSKLPLKDLSLENTYKFLSQVGEFSIALNKKLSGGGEITEQDHQLLVQLAGYSKSFNESVEKMLAFYSQGESITERGGLQINADYKSVGLDNSFTDTESALTDYPTLIYDGPFSDHLVNQTPQMTKNAAEISRNDAQSVIEKLQNIEIGTLNYTGMEESELKCYNFEDKGRNYSVTANGGYLCSILDSREIVDKNLTLTECVAKAEEFLNSNNLTSMASTYYAENSGVCIINFAYENEGTTFYTDLIKVGVAMDNGQIVSFDARGYIMNHKMRQLEAPVYSLAQCQEKLSSYLEVTSVKEAVIPTNTSGEAYTYEFHCKSKATNEEVLVYINNQTGKESNILFLLYTDDGIFVK